jgi:hypothetical protein
MISTGDQEMIFTGQKPASTVSVSQPKTYALHLISATMLKLADDLDFLPLHQVLSKSQDLALERKNGAKNLVNLIIEFI